MRDPARIPLVLAALGRAWQVAPDLRFGQLVENIAGCSGVIVWHAEEDAWLTAIDAFTERMAAVRGGGPPVTYVDPLCPGPHPAGTCERCLDYLRIRLDKQRQIGYLPLGVTDGDLFHDPLCPFADDRVHPGDDPCAQCADLKQARTEGYNVGLATREDRDARHAAVDDLITGLLENGEEY